MIATCTEHPSNSERTLMTSPTCSQHCVGFVCPEANLAASYKGWSLEALWGGRCMGYGEPLGSMQATLALSASCDG